MAESLKSGTAELEAVGLNAIKSAFLALLAFILAKMLLAYVNLSKSDPDTSWGVEVVAEAKTVEAINLMKSMIICLL